MRALRRLMGPALVAAVLAAPIPALARHSHRHTAAAEHRLAAGKTRAKARSVARESLQASPVFAYIKRQAGVSLARRYTRLIVAKADKYRLPPLLVAGVINYESHFDTNCRTGRARGLMQVNHGHERPGQNLYDPATNLDIGCRVLREYHEWAAHHMPPDATAWQVWNRTLTAYNFGPIQVIDRGLMRSRYSRTVLGAYRSNLARYDRDGLPRDDR